MGLGDVTLNIAFFTRSDVIKPCRARFSIRASLEEPEDRQAMVMLLRAGVKTTLPMLLYNTARGDVERVARRKASMATRAVMQMVLVGREKGILIDGFSRYGKVCSKDAGTGGESASTRREIEERRTFVTRHEEGLGSSASELRACIKLRQPLSITAEDVEIRSASIHS